MLNTRATGNINSPMLPPSQKTSSLRTPVLLFFQILRVSTGYVYLL
jgi:hypothetical protein